MKYLILLLTLLITNAFTQDLGDLEILDPKVRFEQIRNERLQRIRRELVVLNSEILKKKKSLESDLDLVTKLKLEAQIEEEQASYNEKKLLFIETATNISLKPPVTLDSKKPLSDDIQQIFDPLIQGVKFVTQKPREIQGLQDRISGIEERLKNALEAQVKMDSFSKENKERKLNPTITVSRNTIKSLVEKLKIELEDAQFKLIKLESNDESIVQTFSNVIFEFFKTKGKNLFIALFVFFLIWWFIGLGQDRFLQAVLMITKQKQTPEPHWVVRPIKVLYSILGLVCALAGSIMTLYIFNDWVMITFVILLFIGLIWGSKQYLPQYYEQIKMTLNFGAVRENERVVYQGIAWKVKNIGYYARLVNPALSGGTIRINTRELLSSHSRLAGENEPWFPTKNNDWVELSDGTYGKVVLQTQENVALKLIGAETKFIPTQEFLKLNPINFSNGFSIDCLLGVDYGIQKDIFTKVIPAMRDGIKERLYKAFDDVTDKFLELSVDFSGAGASSLDVRFFLKCDGSLASRRLELRRKCMSYFVEVCNAEGLTIPFNQLQVHMSK